MKYKFIFMVISVLVVFILVGCSGPISSEISDSQAYTYNDDYKDNPYDIRNYVPDYKKLMENNQAFVHAIIFEENIQWLNLSLTEFDIDRQAVEKYEKDLIDTIRKVSPNRLPLTIALDEFDINNDGNNEIIAFHNGDGGAKDAGVLVVYFIDNGVIYNDITVIGVPDIEFLNDKGLGVIKRSEGMMDLFVLNRIYVWNGSNWTLRSS